MAEEFIRIAEDFQSIQIAGHILHPSSGNDGDGGRQRLAVAGNQLVENLRRGPLRLGKLVVAALDFLAHAHGNPPCI